MSLDSTDSVAIPMVPKRRGLSEEEYWVVHGELLRQKYTYIGVSAALLTQEDGLKNLARQRKELLGLFEMAYSMGFTSIEVVESVERHSFSYLNITVFAK